MRFFLSFSSMPSPSVTIIVRSIPGNIEKGPEEATAAILIRQSKVSIVEERGNFRTSLVVPPPFFHGIEDRELAAMRFQTICDCLVWLSPRECPRRSPGH